MEIMGGLLRLGADSHVPIPWYMRSHLGLATGTQVHLALTAPPLAIGMLPDIIVSPLNPNSFHDTASISITVPEGVGALKSVLERIDESVNVALADSVTIEGRSRHRVNVVLEPADASSKKSHARKVDAFVRGYSAAPNHELLYDRISGEKQIFRMNRRVVVEEGFIRTDCWLEPILNGYAKIVPQFDLSRLVVSSNPDRRLLRYIIPKRGAFSISVPHEDKPGALRQIATVISKSRHNILASRLSRTPPDRVAQNVSVFVAECEPDQGATSAETLARNITRIRGYNIDEPIISDGISAANSVHLAPLGVRSEHFIFPDVSKKYAALHQAHLAPKKPFRRRIRQRLVFISRRFLENWPSGKAKDFEEFGLLRDAVYEAIKSAGWNWIEATPVEQEERAFAEMYSRLWLADRFLVFAFDGNGGVELSPPQGHELGFAMGRMKKVKIVIPENKHRDFKFPNHPDIQLMTYRYPNALRPESADSIANKVAKWLKG
jgi:hypothetical protein